MSDQWGRPGQEVGGDGWRQPQYGQHGQPQYGQAGPSSYPQDAPSVDPGGHGQASDAQVWAQPQYQGQAGQWRSQFGQGAFGGDPWAAPSAGARLGARLLDALIVGVPVGIVAGALVGGLVAGTDTTRDAPTSGQLAGVTALALFIYIGIPLISLLYHGYFGGVKGATLGKRAVGIKVVDERSGRPLGFWRYIGRELVLRVLEVVIVGYFTIFFDNSGRAQGWHDKALSTRAIRG